MGLEKIIFKNSKFVVEFKKIKNKKEKNIFKNATFVLKNIF